MNLLTSSNLSRFISYHFPYSHAHFYHQSQCQYLLKIPCYVFLFLLGYSCFIILCQFLLYNEVTHLGHHRALSWAPCAIRQVPNSYLFCTWQYVSIPISQLIPPPFPPATSTHRFSTSASLFLPCKQVHLYHFFRSHIYALLYNICFSLSNLFQSA